MSTEGMTPETTLGLTPHLARFTTLAVMEGQIRLRPPRHRVDPRAVRYWMTGEAISNVVVAVVLGVLALLIEPARPWLLLALGAALLVGVPYMIVMPLWRYRVHR